MDPRITISLSLDSHYAIILLSSKPNVNEIKNITPETDLSYFISNEIILAHNGKLETVESEGISYFKISIPLSTD